MAGRSRMRGDLQGRVVIPAVQAKNSYDLELRGCLPSENSS